ncbi:MAG: glycosyltransferase family 2 protein [Lachnospiraceae bacterium]|nr:glycosyltransferase family 2 protein [Lachnospiraceae bacterium]
MKEEDKTLISVIIPVYNAENYLDACIQSITAQTYEAWELWLIDDGSKDASGVICDTWAQEDSRIHVVHTENKGAAAARNLGVKKAGGDCVAFIDSDDTVEKEYLEYLVMLLGQYKAEIAVCGYQKKYPGSSKREYFENKLPWKLPNHYPEQIVKNRKKNNSEEPVAMSGATAMEKLLYQSQFMSVPWGMISKRSLWETVSFPEGTKAEDMGCIYKLFATAKRVVYGPEAFYHYYQRGNNTMFSTSNERNRAYYKHCRDMIVYVKANYPEKYGAAVSRHFSACFQILSETPLKKEYRAFYEMLYKDIRKCQNMVLADGKAKIRNRGAALLSLVSIPLLHRVLRIYYLLQKKKVEKE